MAVHVRRSGRHSSYDIHEAFFGSETPRRWTLFDRSLARIDGAMRL